MSLYFWGISEKHDLQQTKVRIDFYVVSFPSFLTNSNSF